MRRIVFLFLLISVISCKEKKLEVDGIRFWKIGATEGYLYNLRTLDIIEDTSILIKSISELGLEEYGLIVFSDRYNIPYAELSRAIGHIGYNYTQYERDTVKAAQPNLLYISEIIYDGTKCAIISEDFVKSKMMYPRETKFKTSTHVHEVEGNKAVVLNKFHSKNSFGVKVDYIYKIWMTHNGNDWTDINNWTMIKLVIESPSTGEQFTFD